MLPLCGNKRRKKKNKNQTKIFIAPKNGAERKHYMNPVNPEIKVGKTVSVGTHLGTESDYGNANGKHLHIEVYEGLETGGPKNPVIVSKSMPTICPYDCL